MSGILPGCPKAEGTLAEIDYRLSRLELVLFELCGGRVTKIGFGSAVNDLLSTGHHLKGVSLARISFPPGKGVVVVAY